MDTLKDTTMYLNYSSKINCHLIHSREFTDYRNISRIYSSRTNYFFRFFRSYEFIFFNATTLKKK